MERWCVTRVLRMLQHEIFRILSLCYIHFVAYFNNLLLWGCLKFPLCLLSLITVELFRNHSPPLFIFFCSSHQNFPKVCDILAILGIFNFWITPQIRFSVLSNRKFLRIGFKNGSERWSKFPLFVQCSGIFQPHNMHFLLLRWYGNILYHLTNSSYPI